MTRVGLFATLCACLAPLLARAQTDVVTIEPIGQYSELFLRNPKVSGNLLVGLRWATKPGSFDPKGVGVKIAEPRQAGNVCVDIASKDGRYTAANLYDLAGTAMRTLRFDSPTKYGEQLRPYTIDDVAVVIHEAKSCDSSGAAVIPALITPRGAPPPASTGRELIAFVNADPEQVGIALVNHKSVLQNGSCRAAEGGVQIAYATVCSLALPESATGPSLTLRLSVKERFKTVPTDYPLLLP